VLSYKFWQRHYRGDPAVVGRTIQLTHKSYTILGVMPPRFTWTNPGKAGFPGAGGARGIRQP
jgi:hypothetical protein